MITFLFLFLAAVCVGVYFWNSNRESTPSGNHYRKRKIMHNASLRTKSPNRSFLKNNESIEARLSVKEPVRSDDFFDHEIETTDDALGLNTTNHKPFSRQPKQHRALQSNCVIALYLMADENTPFLGYELLQVLLSAGLRYGDHRIFHRHVNKDGRGAVLFHCASAKAPGTFDLTKMGSTMCEGLSFFFSADDVEDPVAAFDCLLETVDQLVEDLGGTVLDANRNRLTTETMLQMRDQLRAIEVL